MNLFHLRLENETDLYIAAESWAKAFETHALSEYKNSPVMGIEVVGYGEPVLVQSCVELENELVRTKEQYEKYRELYKEGEKKIDGLTEENVCLVKTIDSLTAAEQKTKQTKKMKKIMFNDKYGLTQDVLEGRKTQTRRIVPIDIINAVDTLCLVNFSKETLTEKEKDYNCYETCDGDFIDVRDVAKYKRGEEIAVAQKYFDTIVLHNGSFSDMGQTSSLLAHPGAKNKMFVRADLMPHRIRITNIRVERLQDISDEDCLKEGVKASDVVKGYWYVQNKTSSNDKIRRESPRAAYAELIDKVSGKGTWESNPWVFVYDFELIK